MLSFSVLTRLALPGLVLGYTWPSPKLDRLESARYEQTGYRSIGPVGAIRPCERFQFAPLGSTVRSNAGDWIRTVSDFLALIRSLASEHM
jgi:hypothetical protein